MRTAPWGSRSFRTCSRSEQAQRAPWHQAPPARGRGGRLPARPRPSRVPLRREPSGRDRDRRRAPPWGGRRQRCGRPRAPGRRCWPARRRCPSEAAPRERRRSWPRDSTSAEPPRRVGDFRGLARAGKAGAAGTCNGRGSGVGSGWCGETCSSVNSGMASRRAIATSPYSAPSPGRVTGRGLRDTSLSRGPKTASVAGMLPVSVSPCDTGSRCQGRSNNDPSGLTYGGAGRGPRARDLAARRRPASQRSTPGASSPARSRAVRRKQRVEFAPQPGVEPALTVDGPGDHRTVVGRLDALREP